MAKDCAGAGSPLGVPSPLSLTPSGPFERHTPSTHIQPMAPAQGAHAATDQDTQHEFSDVESLSLPSAKSFTSESAKSLRDSGGSTGTSAQPKPSLHLSPDLFQRPAVVTASAILSRSGRLHPILQTHNRSGSVKNDTDVGYFTSMQRRASTHSSNADLGTAENGDEEEDQEGSSFASIPTLLKDVWNDSREDSLGKTKKGSKHTGSAIEAIGALFLHQDSAGRLDQLSLERPGKAQDKAGWPLRMPLWLTMFEARAWLGSMSRWFQRAEPTLETHEEPKQKKRKAAAPNREEAYENPPPTPVAMPGSYMRDFDDSLLLPPPLLDEGSDPRSFEGILGVRRMREQQQRKKRLDALRERNRPAHRVDMLTAFSNFVRSAKASETRHGQPQTKKRRRFGLGMDMRNDCPESPTREEVFASLRSEWSKPRRFPSAKTEPDIDVASDDESHAESSAMAPRRPLLRRTATTEPYTGLSRPLMEQKDAETAPASPLWNETRGEEAETEVLGITENEQVLLSTPEQPAELHHPSSPLEELAHHTTYRLTPRAMLDRARTDSLSNSPATTRSGDSNSRQVTPGKNVETPEKDAHLSNIWMAVSWLFVGVTFIPEFIVFLLAHLLDFVMDVYEVLAQTLWFLRWLWLNLTGRTVLGRCFYEAYTLFQSEWAYVAREDHEARGERRKKLQRIPIFHGRKGLSAFQVVRGILELACIQAVTREQYQREGAGLEQLRNWRKKAMAPPTPALQPEQEQGDESDSDEDDDLVVTNRTSDILEISRTTARASGRRASKSSENGGKRHDAAYWLWHEDNAALVRNVKWASQLAMSAYGLQVLIVDLPPVFTPSGRQFPQQTFAHLSRLDADDVLHADIQTLDEEASYSPTFYIVRDMRRKVVCVAVRGTQSFADIVVDLDVRTEDITSTLSEWRGVDLESHSERFAYHAGIWRAARELVKPGSTLFCKLCDALNEHEDFGVVFVGHSLGGAIASAAVILLSEYHIDEPGLEPDPSKGIWRTSGLNGFPDGRRIRAITFAHPSTVSSNLSTRTSFGEVPLVTTVILGSDIIPRFGHGQVRELRRVLGALTRVRRRRARVSTTISSKQGNGSEEEEAVVHVLRRYWDWLSICRNDRPDAVMLDRKRQLEALFWRLRCEVEDDLYSRAKRRFDELQYRTNAPNSPWVRAQNSEPIELHTLSQRRQRLDDATLSSETALGGPLVPAGRVLWLEKGELYNVTNPMSFFSLPDLQSTMFLDHFPAAYEEAILALGRSAT
mgnify:FL=1